MAQMSNDVKLIYRGRYAVLKFNRPERLNAIRHEMYISLSHYIDAVHQNDQIDLLVITGEGKYFSSGADLYSNRLPEPGQNASEFFKMKSHCFQNFVTSLINFSKPLIAAVNGPAVGIGVTLLPHCDVVYASDNSTFLTPFSQVGISPEACSSYLFPKIMGHALASDMLLFNRKITALEAYQCGLVADVFAKETFQVEVDKRITEFLENPGMCLQHGKELIRGPERITLHQVNKEESYHILQRYLSKDPAKQALKFIQRRKDIKKNRSKL